MNASANAPPGILIAGGYGQVGLSIAGLLAPLFPGRVIVAGRRAEPGRAAAASLGHGVRARQLDITDAVEDGALEDVGLVVVCLDQDKVDFAERCVARGIDYVDISADYPFLAQVERLDELAKQRDATAVLSVGVAPGLTNLLAAHSHARMDRLDQLDIVLELGLGDHHGRAAIEWMLDNLDAEYEIRENDRSRVVRSFAEARVFAVAGGGAKRAAYRFSFSDQQVLARTLGVPTVSSWVLFSSRSLTWLVARGSRIGLGRVLRNRWCRRLALWLVTHLRVGSARCSVSIRATGANGAGPMALSVGLTGHNEAAMTAAVAAETVRQVATGSLDPGVFHIEQVIALDPIVAALDRALPDLVWEL